jgi:hypothetical protein
MNHGPNHQKKKTIITNPNLVLPKPKMPRKIECKLNNMFPRCLGCEVALG